MTIISRQISFFRPMFADGKQLQGIRIYRDPRVRRATSGSSPIQVSVNSSHRGVNRRTSMARVVIPNGLH